MSKLRKPKPVLKKIKPPKRPPKAETTLTLEERLRNRRKKKATQK